MNKPLGFLALIFMIGGLCLGIVALATNHWAEKDDHSMGLFESCEKHTGYKGVWCSSNLDDDHRDKYKDDGKFHFTN